MSTVTRDPLVPISPRQQVSIAYQASVWPKKTGKSYRALLMLFRDPKRTLKSIARDIGISNTGCHELYAEYFAIATGWSARARWRLGIRERRDELARELPSDHSALGAVAAAAEAAYIIVRQVPYQGPETTFSGVALEMKKRVLSLNGIPCLVHSPTMLHSKTGQPYAIPMFCRETLMTYPAHIVFIRTFTDRHLLVIPARILRGIGKTSRYIQIWIPLQGYCGTRHPKIDWLQFKDAWHLLEGED